MNKRVVLIVACCTVVEYVVHDVAGPVPVDVDADDVIGADNQCDDYDHFGNVLQFPLLHCQ